jgi:hypothetical protein
MRARMEKKPRDRIRTENLDQLRCTVYIEKVCHQAETLDLRFKKKDIVG